MAHGFKTGGRKKGSVNKVTSEMKAAIAASGETPLEYMLRIMRDEAADSQGETTWLKRLRHICTQGFQASSTPATPRRSLRLRT